MNIIEICEYKYPGQISLGNISFSMPENELIIAYWNVPNELQPTNQQLLEYGLEHQRLIEINALSKNVLPLIQNKIDKTATEKNYANGVSCASYKDSTNVQWSAEATTFIVWRDSVWSYAYALLAQYEGNQEQLPTVQQVIDGIIPIVWP